MNADDLDGIAMDAQLAFPRIGELSAAMRCQSLSRLRQAMKDALGVGGTKPEVCRAAKFDARHSPMVQGAERELGEDAFSNLVRWFYDRLHSAEGVQ